MQVTASLFMIEIKILPDFSLNALLSYTLFSFVAKKTKPGSRSSFTQMPFNVWELASRNQI
jgi:hypothetical protein